MKIKEHSFICEFILLPFVILISLFSLNGYLNGNIYNLIFAGSFIFFWISFIIALFFASNEIINSNNRKRLFPLMLIPFIYLPFYYVKYVLDSKRIYGVVPALINIILLVGLFISVKNYTEAYVCKKYLEVAPSFYTYKR